MGQTYIVKEGDTLTRIAHNHGFRSWQAIYEHDRNAELRELRPNPNVLYPGDRVYLPKRELKTVKEEAGARHSFRLKRLAAKFRVVVADEDGNALS